MRSSREEMKDKVDVDRVLNDIRSLRNRLFEMTPIVTTPPIDDPQGSKLTLSRLGPPPRRPSPTKESDKGGKNNFNASRDKEREKEIDRERRAKLSSPTVLRNRSLELKKSLLLESETSEGEDGLQHSEFLSDIPSNADQDRAFSDSDDDLRFVFQNGKSKSHTSPKMASSAPIKSSSPVRPGSASRREREASPPVTRRSTASRDELVAQLEESKRELKRRNHIEKEFQEVGEGLRKLAVEREAEIEQLQSENLHLKSLVKSLEADLKRARNAQKTFEKELENARKAETEVKTQTVELEAKLQFEAQRNTKLLARLRASEITSDMESVYPAQLGQSTSADVADERDILITKLKGLVSELQNQLGNVSQREKERSGDIAEDARRAKDELERARAECTMHKDITTRMAREIQALEHDLQSAQAQVRRLQTDLEHSSRNIKDRDRSERDKAQDERRREEDIRKLHDDAQQRELDVKAAWQDVRRLEEDNRRVITQNHAYTRDLEELRNEVARLSRERKELALSLRQREDELNNSRSSFLDAEKELLDMSGQVEALTKEMITLRDTAADAESNRKFAEISLEMRDRAAKLDEDLRLATIHFQKELTRQERDYNARAEIERMNHLDALVTTNQEKEKAERAVRELETMLRDRTDELSKARTELNHLTAELDEKSKNLRHYIDMEQQIDRQLNDLNSELYSSAERERRIAAENSSLKDEVSALQLKTTELMEMISSREKRETSVLDKLKQSEADIAVRTKDLRRLARALKLHDEKLAKLQEEKDACLREKDDAVAEVNSELERSRSELAECARSLVSLEDELLRLRRDAERAEHELRTKADLEHELRVKTEEASLLEHEVVKLQGIVTRQQKELAELDKDLRTADSKVVLHRDLSNRRSEDVSNLQANVSTLTTKLKSQLDNLMRLQSQPPSPSPPPVHPH